jgi:hypothetical protein
MFFYEDRSRRYLLEAGFVPTSAFDVSKIEPATLSMPAQDCLSDANLCPKLPSVLSEATSYRAYTIAWFVITRAENWPKCCDLSDGFAMSEAISFDYIFVARELLRRGTAVPINIWDNVKSKELAWFLLDEAEFLPSNAELPAGAWPPLHRAVQYCDADIVQALLESGKVDVNALVNGRTALDDSIDKILDLGKATGSDEARRTDQVKILDLLTRSGGTTAAKLQAIH